MIWVLITRACARPKNILSENLENVSSDMCAQGKFRSACTFMQSDQNLLLCFLDSQGHKNPPLLAAHVSRCFLTLQTLCFHVEIRNISAVFG